MAHLADIGGTEFVHPCLVCRGWRDNVLELVLRNHRDDVIVKDTKCSDLLGDFRDVLVVDSRDIDGINLDKHAALDSLFNTF